MALQSPGVQVTVIDESQYTPAEPGTTPLIVVATAQDKTSPAGTTATGTTKANAGRAFRLTSQKDLVDFFGVPFFEKSSGSNPVHGGERNEYGLLTAYSYLGVSNSAFVVRADVDLSQLAGRASAPGSNPSDGQWWVDTQTTAWGIQEWNSAPASTVGGQKFAYKLPIVLTNDDSAKLENGTWGKQPKGSVGSIGSYAVVFETADDDNARIFYKSAGGGVGVSAGDWVLVGSNEWKYSHPTVISSGAITGTLTGEIRINGTNINVDGNLESVRAAINAVMNDNGITAVVENNRLYLYSNGANDFGGIGNVGLPGDSSGSNAILLENVTGTLFGTSSSNLGDLKILAGTYFAPALQQTPHTQVPRWKSTDIEARPSGSVWIKTTEPNNGARWRVRRWNEATVSWVQVDATVHATPHAALFALDRGRGGAGIPVDTVFVQSNSDEASGFDLDPETATFKMWRRAGSGRTLIKSRSFSNVSGIPTGTIEFTISESIVGQAGLSSETISVNLGSQITTDSANDIASAINAAGFASVEAAVTAEFELEIFHNAGGDFRITTGTGGVMATIFATSPNFYELPDGDYLASNWAPFIDAGFVASGDAPLEDPQDGQLWYNPEFSEVDIMVHDGDTWKGINNVTEYANAQVIVAASEPILTDAQKDQTNHLWISTANLENFPTIYRWSVDFQRWDQIDKTDQETEDGILFADARFGSSGATGDVAASISDLLTSNYLDPDAPDPALYPRGMLLWNLRRSGGNVKRYSKNFIDTALDNLRVLVVADDEGNLSPQSMSAYATDRWVTASANNEDGSGSFGRKAQRKVVVAALKSAVDTSSEIRDQERRNFNLIAAPGYPELMQNLVSLNLERGVTSFVVGDVPFRLPADATSLTRWGTNEDLAFDNGDDGLVSYDEYLGVFYPSGITTDLSGSNAVVPSSHMMLRTIALSDNVSYPWFAPAGTRRGGITNATNVGYIDAGSGEFQVVALNDGQRDTLYDLKINPLTFFNGVGLVNYGQKTRARNASALDRINVARLVVYLRSQLQKLARPYIFEPNDKITRDEVKQAVESLLLELVGLRAIYDFAVVCDESNNTPTRIDRNELWVDIAIEPVKAVEFIYIPLRVKNTGEI